MSTSTIVYLLVGAFAGFLMGKHTEGAREAHHRFSSYRTRTVSNLGAWFTETVRSVGIVLAVAVVLFLIFSS